MKIFLFSNRFGGADLGGMEVHREAFIEYFSRRAELYLLSNDGGYKMKHGDDEVAFKGIDDVIATLRDRVDGDTLFFFNDMRWINDLKRIRSEFEAVPIFMRSGGNDVFRAPVGDDSEPLHLRQQTLVEIINSCVTKLIVNSNYSYLRNVRIGITARKMVKIRGGVDVKLAKRLIEDAKANRKAFNREHNINRKNLLAIVSRLVPFKGIIPFLDNIKDKMESKNYYLLIVGDGSEYDAIQEKLNSEFPEGTYCLIKGVSHEEAMKYISIADAFINPSIEYAREMNGESYIHTETMGRSMMEAVCLRVPVVARDVGGTAELFEEVPSAGIMWHSNATIAKNINRGLSTITKNNNIEMYDFSAVFAKYMILYESLRGNNRRVYCFDIDGTIVSNEEDVKTVPALIHNLRGIEDMVVINSARMIDESTIRLSHSCDAEYMILGTGTFIYRNSREGEYQLDKSWAKYVSSYGIPRDIISCAEALSEVLPSDKVMSNMLTCIVISDTNREELEMISEIMNVNYPMLKCVGADFGIKIVSKYINKRTAFEYIVKDLIKCPTLVCCGDSALDIDFINIGDLRYTSKAIDRFVEDNGKKSVFKKGESKVDFVTRIMKRG